MPGRFGINNLSRKRGVTAVEMLIMAVIALFLATVLYRIFFGQISLYAEKEAEQNIQRSIRSLFINLSVDIKGVHQFKEITSHKLVFTRFTDKPDLNELSTPAEAVNSSEVEYSYDEEEKELVRYILTDDGERKKRDRFENISPDFAFEGIKVITGGSLEVIEEGHEYEAVGVRVKILAEVQITSKKTEKLSMTATFRSRFRDRAEQFGPLYRVDSSDVEPERLEHRLLDPSDPWKRNMGYFCSVDEDCRY